MCKTSVLDWYSHFCSYITIRLSLSLSVCISQCQPFDQKYSSIQCYCKLLRHNIFNWHNVIVILNTCCTCDSWLYMLMLFWGKLTITIEENKENQFFWGTACNRVEEVLLLLYSALCLKHIHVSYRTNLRNMYTQTFADPLSMSAQKALETIGANLQKQYDRWQPRARYKQSLDPTVDEVKKLCISLRRNAKVGKEPLCIVSVHCECSCIYYYNCQNLLFFFFLHFHCM